MLQYIPAPNTANGSFATSAYNQILRDDKGAVRVDAKSRVGLLSAYYFIDDFNLNNPYPVAQSGASVPGFSALTTGRAQLISLGDTKMLNATAFNELHLSYTVTTRTLVSPSVASASVSSLRVSPMPMALRASCLSIPRARASRILTSMVIPRALRRTN